MRKLYYCGLEPYKARRNEITAEKAARKEAKA